MGAGASISDEEELKKYYETEKNAGKFSEDQVTDLEKTYNDLKEKGKGEFLIIGKCKKKYEEFYPAEAAPAPAPAAKATAAPEPAAKPFPAGPPEGTVLENVGPNPVICCSATEIPDAIKKAQEAKLTPLVIDRSEAHVYETFMEYNGSQLMDTKAMGLKVTKKEQTVAESMEDGRKKVVAAMRFGKPLHVSLQGFVCDFNGKFNDTKEVPAEGKAVLPLELFENSGKGLATAEWAKKLYRPDELDSGMERIMADKFEVICSTYFNWEDVSDFLFKDGYGLPPGKFQPIWVQHEDGTPAIE